jgi:uncharacterized protein with ATP-grasp and redox domains
MRSGIECFPCFLRQAISAMRHAEVDEQTQTKVLRKLMCDVAQYSCEASPAENSSLVLHKVCEYLELDDPYAKAKLESNEAAMMMVQDLRETIMASLEPLSAAVRAAVAGNVVDLGILESYDLDAALEEAFSVSFRVYDNEAFKADIYASKTVLYIGDNSGEIAFDRLLVEQIARTGAKVTYAVKAAPVLNDATLEDAFYVGMDKVARVITNGNKYLGTILRFCSEEFLEAFAEADTIVAKRNRTDQNDDSNN